jgi:hypothetical protein
MRDAAGFFIAVTLLVVVPVAAIMWIAQMAMVPGQFAEIEQLRRDAAVVDPAQAEDVIGQVTEWNRVIASNQAYNDVFLISIFIPDEWDTVELIEVPQ